MTCSPASSATKASEPGGIHDRRSRLFAKTAFAGVAHKTPPIAPYPHLIVEFGPPAKGSTVWSDFRSNVFVNEVLGEGISNSGVSRCEYVSGVVNAALGDPQNVFAITYA